MELIKFISFLLLISLFSCKSDKSEQNVSNLEQTVKANPNGETVQKLLATYQTELERTDLDVTAKSTIVGKLAQLQLDNKQIPEAIQTLKNGMSNYHAASGTADHLWTLGEVFKNQRPTVTKTIQKLYTNLYPSGKNSATIKQMLASDTTSIYQHLDNLGSAMYNEETHRLKTNVAGDFIESCDVFAILKPEDPKSPDYLHKAGETARAIKNFNRAIGIYDRVHTNYPEFAKAPQALFLKAFTYDNDLKNYDQARALYTEFLEKYPNDDFADDTQFLLKNLGKTDEEIIKGFSQEKKQ